MTTQTEVLKLAQDVIQMLGAPSPLHFSKDEIIKWQKCNAAIKEALAQDDLQALHDENERLGLYKDAYAQPEQREPTKKENYLLMGALKRSGKVVAQPAVSETHKQEPVAMKFKIYKPTVPDPMRQGINNALLPWVYDQDRSSGFDASMWVTPVATLSPQRKPLTDEQIIAVVPDTGAPMSLGEAFYKFARAIEAAHGIKE